MRVHRKNVRTRTAEAKETCRHRSGKTAPVTYGQRTGNQRSNGMPVAQLFSTWITICRRWPPLPHNSAKLRKAEADLCCQSIFQRRWPPTVITPIVVHTSVMHTSEVCGQHFTMQLCLDDGYLDNRLLFQQHPDTHISTHLDGLSQGPSSK